jgi:hypothetical protein
MKNEKLTEQESLQLISQMINKAKNSYHDSGIGPILWGSVISFCSLVTFASWRFDFKLPFDIWLLTLVAVVPQIFIVSREKKLNKFRSYDEATMDYVWMSFGISIFLLVFINNYIATQLNPVFQTYIDVKGTRPPHNFTSFNSTFFLLLYGIPTIITGGARRFKPMLYGGILCWVCCIASLFTAIDTDMLLIAIAAVAAWLIPGIILFKKRKNEKAVHV